MNTNKKNPYGAWIDSKNNIVYPVMETWEHSTIALEVIEKLGIPFGHGESEYDKLFEMGFIRIVYDRCNAGETDCIQYDSRFAKKRIVKEWTCESTYIRDNNSN